MRRNDSEGKTYHLKSPVLSLEFDQRPPYWSVFITLWMVGFIVALALFAWGYVFLLPDVIGFEKTVLLGIALLVIGVGKPQ